MNRFQIARCAVATAIVLGSTTLLVAAIQPTPVPAPVVGGGVPFSFAKIYWEYNSSANDLGVHVTLDGEDWKSLEIENPSDTLLFKVAGKGPYFELGMTELFFEGAEPNLDEVPLDELLAKFPEGTYDFSGLTVANEEIESTYQFSHAIPDGPKVLAQVGADNFLRIRWSKVTQPPVGFPRLPIHIVGYQVIVGSFQVTVPPDVFSVTVPPEYVATYAPGTHPFEVLAIERSANQTLTEGTFTK